MFTHAGGFRHGYPIGIGHPDPVDQMFSGVEDLQFFIQGLGST